MSEDLFSIVIAIFTFCFIMLLILFASFMESAFGEEGLCSWYGSGEESEGLNEYTASGEKFNPDDYTCAIWEYEFGQILKVTNLETGASVEVRKNDLGPAKRLERLIDLSKRAFSEIADCERGLIKVKVNEITLSGNN